MQCSASLATARILPLSARHNLFYPRIVTILHLSAGQAFAHLPIPRNLNSRGSIFPTTLGVGGGFAVRRIWSIGRCGVFGSIVSPVGLGWLLVRLRKVDVILSQRLLCNVDDTAFLTHPIKDCDQCCVLALFRSLLLRFCEFGIRRSLFFRESLALMCRNWIIPL